MAGVSQPRRVPVVLTLLMVAVLVIPQVVSVPAEARGSAVLGDYPPLSLDTSLELISPASGYILPGQTVEVRFRLTNRDTRTVIGATIDFDAIDYLEYLSATPPETLVSVGPNSTQVYFNDFLPANGLPPGQSASITMRFRANHTRVQQFDLAIAGYAYGEGQEPGAELGTPVSERLSLNFVLVTPTPTPTAPTPVLSAGMMMVNPPPTLEVGDDMNVRIDFGNAGQQAMNSISVELYYDADAFSLPTPPQGADVVLPGYVRFPLAVTLNPGQSTYILTTFHVLQGCPPGGDITVNAIGFNASKNLSSAAAHASLHANCSAPPAQTTLQHATTIDGKPSPGTVIDVAPGAEVVYELRVTNGGAVPADQLYVSIILPPEMQNPRPSGNGQINTALNSISWPAHDLPAAGGSEIFQVISQVPLNAADGTQYEFREIITSDNTPSYSSNRTIRVRTGPTATPTRTPTPDAANPNAEIQCKLVDPFDGEMAVGEQMILELVAKNTGNAAFSSAGLTLQWDADCLKFDSSAPPPYAAGASGAGVREWALSDSFLAKGGQETVRVTLTGAGDCKAASFGASLEATITQRPPTTLERTCSSQVRVVGPTPTATRTYTARPTSTHTATATRTPTHTATRTTTRTHTATKTSTHTRTVTATRTPTRTPTLKPGDPTYTATRTGTRTPTATRTAQPTSTGTRTYTPPPTATRTRTSTPRPTSTPMPTATQIPEQGACTQLLMNRTFEMGSLAYWLSSGALLPRVVSDTTHSGDSSLLLGLPKISEIPGDGWAWQWVTIPQNATAAPWRFWYNVYSQDGDARYDWFEAGVFDSQTMLISEGTKSTGTLGWTHAEIDLASYAGKTIALAFHVRQDGNAGSTWAFVDDVSLCVEPLAIPAPGPSAASIEGACFAAGGIPDYAPSGMPDFEMVRQGANSGQIWTQDAPAAAANALWWLDSLNEPGSVPPPAKSDGFSLVTTYDGANDDHAAANVEDLIADLAAKMGTGTTGTSVASANAGLTAYLSATWLSSQFAVTGIQAPSYATLQIARQAQKGVILLLGFWEWQGRDWKRLGGHYVTLAGAGCDGADPTLAISDPWRDNAEHGFAGRVLPAQRHLHSGSPIQNAHDNAVVVSHDLYPVGSTDGAATLVGYGRGIADIANFLGLNAATAPTSAYQGGQIVTRIDFALLIAPPGLADVVEAQAPPTARVHGLVQHQAWPAVNFPVIVSLHEPTSQYPTYSWAITTTNASEFTTALFEPGQYVVKAKAARTLQNAATTFNYPAGITDANLATLVTGDVNNDNHIDGLDVSAISGQIATGTYNALPDLNHDNAVNGADLALVWPNFGKAGDIIVAGPAIQSDAEAPLAAPQVAATVPGAFLNLVPSASQAYLGQVFGVNVVAQLPEDAADTVELHLDFDPAVLQVVDAQGQPSTQIQGGILALVAHNQADNAAGRIDFCATTTDPGGKKGSFVVARILFKAVAPSAGTWVRFARDRWPYTEVSYRGEALLRRFSGAEIAVSATPPNRAYLPVVMSE